MKKIILLLACIFTIALHGKKIDNQKTTSIITYKLNGGRFGDNLLSYSKAKWLSYIYDIPLYYISFLYSDQLQLHVRGKKYTNSIAEQFSYKKILPRNILPILDPYAGYVYINQWYTKSDINWNDPVFVDEIKKDFAPLHKIEKISIPKNCISVAVHIRLGGGFIHDDMQAFNRYPLRFVPVQFYIDQVKRISSLFKGQHLYVHIFTDHINPQELVQQFNSALHSNTISYGYRTEGNTHSANVLEDFFSMMDFDCLIRPGSHFSRFVERLGNNKLIIYPSHAHKIRPQEYRVDEITIKTKTDTNSWKREKISV